MFKIGFNFFNIFMHKAISISYKKHLNKKIDRNKIDYNELRFKSESQDCLIVI